MRYSAVIVLAHCIVFFALAYGVILKAEKAQVALVHVPRCVLILLPGYRYDCKIMAKDVANFRRAGDGVADNGREYGSLLWVGRNGWGHYRYGPSLNFQFLITDR